MHEYPAARWRCKGLTRRAADGRRAFLDLGGDDSAFKRVRPDLLLPARRPSVTSGAFCVRAVEQSLRVQPRDVRQYLRLRDVDRRPERVGVQVDLGAGRWGPNLRFCCSTRSCFLGLKDIRLELPGREHEKVGRKSGRVGI